MDLYTNPEAQKALLVGSQKIIAKHTNNYAKFTPPGAIDAIKALQARYKDNYASPEYLKEMNELYSSISPNMNAINEEFAAMRAERSQQ